MKCVNGHDNAPGAQFCALCGESVVAPAPQTASWGRRRWGALAGGGVGLVAVVVTAVILLNQHASGNNASDNTVSATATTSVTSAAATPGVETWLCSFTNAALLLQWPDDDGVVSGSYQQAILQGAPPNQRVSNSSGNITGTDTNGTVAIKVDDGQSWYGSISGGALTINVPQNDGTLQTDTCASASPADWNSAVADLGSAVSSSNSTAATQQQYANDSSALQAAIATLQRDSDSLNQSTVLGGDVNSTKGDVGSALTDYNAEQKDDCSSMQGDAQTVAGDVRTVQGDQQAELQDVQSLDNSVNGLQQDISKVKGLDTIVSNEGGSSPTDPMGSVANANKVIGEINQSISWANGQIANLIGQVKGIAAQAQNYANAHGC